MPKIKPEDMRKLTRSVFQAAGTPPEDAEIVAHLIVLSNLRGHDSHGVRQIPRYIDRIRDKEILPGKEMTIERDTPSLAVLNGNNNFGHVAATRAMEMAIEKARNVGVAAVAVHQLYHIGRVGAYPEMAAAENMIGLCFAANKGKTGTQAPFGGTEARLSTAPISAAFPIPGDEPILLDFATSVVASNKIGQALDRGKPAGPEWLIDKRGNPVEDPKIFMQGEASLLPLGGVSAHKGYGLAVLCTILSGILSGGGTVGSDPDVLGYDNHTFMIVLDPFAFVTREFYEREIKQLTAHLRTSKVRPGDPPVQMPGEYETACQRKVESDGIDIEPSVWNRIVKTAESLGVNAPQPIPER